MYNNSPDKSQQPSWPMMVPILASTAIMLNRKISIKANIVIVPFSNQMRASQSGSAFKQFSGQVLDKLKFIRP